MRGCDGVAYEIHSNDQIYLITVMEGISNGDIPIFNKKAPW